MATWKKVIVSGSNAHLTSVTASTAVSVGSNQQITTNPNTTFLSGSFSGSFTGNINATITTAVTASTVAITDASSAATTQFITFVGATSGHPTQSVDVGLTFLPSTDTLTLGNVAANSGSLTTTATTANVFNANATTVNAFGAATAVTIGATPTSTITLRGGTLVGDATTQNIYNTTAQTINFGGAATSLVVGATTGVTAVRNDLTVTGSTILGDTSGDAVTINAATVKIANVGAGTTDTVIIRDGSNNLATRAIDTRVWGTTLIDASGTPSANQVAYFTDANTVAGTAGFTYTPGTSLFTAPNVLITGDITVQGTASFQQTTNLQVADRFVLLASGSNSTTDGGIVVQQATLGVGELFGWDAGTSRWSVTSSFTANVSNYTPDAFVSLVTTAAASDPNTTSPPARYNVVGNIYVSSTVGDEGIWIYS